MVFHDVVARGAATTSGSATRRGSSTTSCTRTRSSSGGVRVADRLRRLAADARRRRARGVLTADYNAEMIEHIARYPRVRDRAIFVGDPDDIVAERFGAGAAARSATGPSEHFDFAGLRHRLRPGARSPTASGCAPSSATAPDEQVCIVTVGGSGVGARPAAAGDRGVPRGQARACPSLRMIVVAGPRIDPATLPAADGLEVRAVRARPLPAPGGVRPRGRPGRADDRDGADRQPAAVPLLPAAAPLRAELPRPPPARALRRRAAAWTSTTRRPDGDRRGDRGGDRPRGRLPPGRDRRRRAGGGR